MPFVGGSMPDFITTIFIDLEKSEKWEYMDNYRWCQIGNKEQEESFRLKSDQGCCVSHEEEFTMNGITWKIGFNHGH